MGRKAREEAVLRALARKVWGDSYYERHAANAGTRAPRRHRLTAIAGIGVGAPLLLSALAMVAFSTVASAHTSTITITCTKVQFSYQNFESTVATAHESVTIDGVQAAQKDFTFNGPSASDSITITIGDGTHTVHATNQWFFNGKTQGTASASQTFSHCGSGTTTTTTSPSSSTSTTAAPASTTTTVAETSTSSSSTSTSTTVAESTTTIAPETTTTEFETTTTPAGPDTSTTIAPDVSTTTVPVGTEGSTSTTTPVGPQGSTSPPSTAITPTPNGSLPFTGSGPFPLEGALAALGVGLLALGCSSLRQVVDHGE